MSLATINSYSQCSGCTSTIATNTSITIGAGQIVCLTFAGNYTQTINLNGGTLCVSSSTHIIAGTINCNTASTLNVYGSIATALSNFNTGFTLNNYGSFTGTISQTGGAVINYSGATFNPSSATFTSGSLVNNSGGNTTMPAVTIGGGYTFTNNGTASLSNITISSGATVSLNGTQTISGSVINSGTINLSGSLTIGGTYADFAGATIVETQSGCNTLTIATDHGGNGTFNGGGNGMIVNSAPGNAGSMINGASAVITAPVQQPSSLSIPLTGLTVNGSFTSPSAAISGYIVLRYIGVVAPVDNPINYTTYTVGSTIGSSTVVALVIGGSIGTETFTDNIPTGHCGQNIYYRIFSYEGTGACRSFDLAGPLTGSVTIPVPIATVTASGPLSVCLGDLTLTATGGGTYLWSDGETTASISPAVSLTYTVTVTNASGCTASAGGLAVTISLLPSSSVNSATVCPGSSVTLTATGGLLNTYRWSTGSTSSSIGVTPAVTTTYTCTVSEILGLGCSVAVSGTVTIDVPIPTVNSPSICGGMAATLTASGGTSYHWSTGASTTSITTATAGTYTVTATDGIGCTATASGTATAHALPIPTVNNASICSGTSATLIATGGSTYLWNTGSGATSISPSPLTNTTYTVTATNAFGCTASASGTVTVKALPTPTVNSPSICAGNTATLTATGGGTYLWNTGAATASITSTTSGTYNVTVTGVNSCSATASGTVTVNSLSPSISVTAACSGSLSTLTASGGSSYVWNTGATTASISSSTASTYTVTATGATGCTVSVSAAAVIKPTPSVSISTNTPVCLASPATMTATVSGSTSYSYSWSGPLSFSSSAASFTISSPTLLNSGTYTITVTAANSCVTTAAGTLSVVNCLSVSGSIFDDANGNGLIDGTDAAGTLGHVLYSVLSDTTGTVVAVSSIAANGTFAMGNVLPNTSGFRMYVSSSSPAIGSSSSGYSWPAGWAGTLGQYGKNNLAGTGIDGVTSALMPVATGTK